MFHCQKIFDCVVHIISSLTSTILLPSSTHVRLDQLLLYLDQSLAINNKVSISGKGKMWLLLDYLGLLIALGNITMSPQ